MGTAGFRGEDGFCYATMCGEMKTIIREDKEMRRQREAEMVIK